MSNNRRDRSRRRVADMSEPEEELSDRPWLPPPEECEEHSYTVSLSADERYWTRQVIHQGETVDFAIGLQVRDEGEYHDVLRYDCYHRVIHIHRFKKSGAEPIIEDVEEIPWSNDKAARKLVGRNYDSVLDTVIYTYEDSVAAWRSM